MSHPTAQLDDVVHQRTRLGVLAILSRGDRVEFGYLQEVLGLSAGNLSRHLTTLIEARLVTVDKGYQGRRPRTWVSITTAGHSAYADEMAILRSLLALADAGAGAGADAGLDGEADAGLGAAADAGLGAAADAGLGAAADAEPGAGVVLDAGSGADEPADGSGE